MGGRGLHGARLKVACTSLTSARVAHDVPVEKYFGTVLVSRTVHATCLSNRPLPLINVFVGIISLVHGGPPSLGPDSHSSRGSGLAIPRLGMPIFTPSLGPGLYLGPESGPRLGGPLCIVSLSEFRFDYSTTSFLRRESRVDLNAERKDRAAAVPRTVHFRVRCTLYAESLITNTQMAIV